MMYQREVIALPRSGWRAYVKPAFFDAFALAFVYFLPAVSHMLGVKLYLLEPMRFMLILALVHTHKRNAYLLALSLPLFSFLVSGHPILLKSLLIAAELTMNVFVFYLLWKRIPLFLAAFGSIWISKLFYYGLKYVLILLVWPGTALVGIPLWIQAGTSVCFGLYFFAMGRKTMKGFGR